MAAGTVAVTVTEAGQTTLTRTYNVADVSVITSAYQGDANVSVNGTATRAQVLNYAADTYAASIKSTVQKFQTVPATIPPPITMT